MSIINYLEKKVQEVTAPREWQSSPESPPTKLAYITQPEIDMLVKANIHGSMKGKPNKGPEDIMSLDGGGKEEAYSEKVKNFKTPSSRIDTSKQSGRDKRQEFRDRTGSSVVSESEAQQRDNSKTSGSGDSGGGGISSDVLSTALGFVNPGLGIFAKYGGPLIKTILKNSKSLFGDRPVGEDIYQKLIDGEELTQDERIKLIDLQKKLNKEEGFNEFSFDDDSTYLNRKIGDSTIGDLLSNSGIVDKGLFNKLMYQRYDNQDLIDDQDNLGFKKTIQQGLGFNMPEGYLSQTDAMKQLGPEQLAALQRLYPETYYGDSTEKDDYLGFKPRSQRELEDLAAMDISAAKGNEGLVREIARARETLRREGREAPAGIASLAPVLPPASPPITTPSPPLVLPGLPSPTPTPVNPETLPIMPGNQTANQYTQLGIPQVAPNLPGGFAPGNFGDYYNYLNQFYNTTRR